MKKELKSMPFWIHPFTDKVKKFGLSGAILTIFGDRLIIRFKNKKPLIKDVEGFGKWAEKQKKIKVSVGILPDGSVLVGLAGEDGFGYVWNLDTPYFSEWGRAADLTKAQAC